MVNKRNIITLALIVILLLAIPIGLKLIQNQQNLRSKAAGAPIAFQGPNVTTLNGKQIFRLDDQGTPTVGLTLTSPFGAGQNIDGTSSNYENSINWSTNLVTWTADDFNLTVNNKIFTTKGATVDLKSEENTVNPAVDLAVRWRENGVDMEFLTVFYLNKGVWSAPIAYTYDGNDPPKEIFYNIDSISNSEGNQLNKESLIISSWKGSPVASTITFKNIKILPKFTAGAFPTSPQPTNGSSVISGKVFLDLNKNNFLDNNEPVVSNTPVLLGGNPGSGNSPLIKATQTDINGNYTFSASSLIVGQQYSISSVEPGTHNNGYLVFTAINSLLQINIPIQVQ